MSGKVQPMSKTFWPFVSPEPNTGCWLFDKHGPKSGYAVTANGRGGRSVAHRVSWEIHHGLIPAGMVVCHKCDVRCCVNPDHLFIGTQRDNILDMHSKGRDHQTANPSSTMCGSRVGTSKLTETDVRAIKELSCRGMSQRRIAARFHVAQTTVSDAVRGRSWKRALAEKENK